MIRYFLLGIALLLLTGCNDWRMWETPGIKPHEEPLLIMEQGTVPFTGTSEAILRATPDLAALAPPAEMSDAGWIAAGKTGYATYCVQCHGKHLDGMGTVGQSFEPLPTNLRSSQVQEQAAGELFFIVSYSLPGLRHPGLATTISENERWQIVAYLQSLGRISTAKAN